MKTKLCKKCGVEFVPINNRPKQKYCSRKCLKKACNDRFHSKIVARRKATVRDLTDAYVVCKLKSAGITTPTQDQITTKRIQILYKREQKCLNDIGMQRCKICGEVKTLKEFHKQAGYKYGHRAYCIQCRREAWTKPKSTIKKVCSVCESEFAIDSSIKRQRYCSKKCAGKANREKMESSHPGYSRLRLQKGRAELDDNYIKNMVLHKYKNVGQDIVELKRIHITLKRLKNEQNKQSTNP